MKLCTATVNILANIFLAWSTETNGLKEIKMTTNKTRWIKSLSLKEVEGPIFIQTGGEMKNIFRQEHKGARNRDCCRMLKITGNAIKKYPKAGGIFKLHTVPNENPEYINGNGWLLYWNTDKRAYMVGPNKNGLFGVLRNPTPHCSCPTFSYCKRKWEYWDDNKNAYVKDKSLRATCIRDWCFRVKTKNEKDSGTDQNVRLIFKLDIHGSTCYTNFLNDKSQGVNNFCGPPACKGGSEHTYCDNSDLKMRRDGRGIVNYSGNCKEKDIHNAVSVRVAVSKCCLQIWCDGVCLDYVKVFTTDGSVAIKKFWAKTGTLQYGGCDDCDDRP